GRLMVAVGFLWFAAGLFEANDPWLFTTSILFGALFLAVFVHLLLAFPGARPLRRSERAVVVAGYALAVLANALQLPFSKNPESGCDGCPPNKLLAVNSPAATTAIQIAADIAGLVLAACVVAILVRRWRAATPAGRRVLGPVYLSGGVAILFLGLGFAIDPISSGVSMPVQTLAELAFISVPYFFVAGLMRARVGLEKDRLQADLRARVVELEREQEFVRTVVNNAPAIFLVVDPEGRVTRFNDQLSRMSGIEDTAACRDELFWEIFVAAEDRE